ncbi:hypothetical protein [Polymorphospora rubra]|uniref:hypothetical protein n=1 Tax=Polymorphospora rubra TaxID=338584 RepID=UPI0033C20215
MAEYDEIDHAFADLRGEVFERVLPAGPAAVRTTVRRRRHRAAVTGATVAVLLVAGPVAGYAALQDPVQRPETGATGAPTERPATLTPTLPAPTVSASPSAVPDGRISRAELLDTKVDLPPWPGNPGCRTEQARLEAAPSNQPAIWLGLIAYGDVDRDGAAETLAEVQCLVGQGGPVQVVAFDRDAGGKIITMGAVVRSGTGGIEDVRALDPRADGSIRIEVADRIQCCGIPLESVRRQWRTYALDGANFVQIGGPTSFGPGGPGGPGGPATPSPTAGPPRTDLSVTATDVRFTEQPDDMMRHGVVTVVIRNAGPVDADLVRLRFLWDTGVTLIAEGDGWSTCSSRDIPVVGIPPEQNPVCIFGPLRAGQQRTLVLGISYNKDWAATGIGTAVVERVNDVPDRNPDDNQDPFNYR